MRRKNMTHQEIKRLNDPERDERMARFRQRAVEQVERKNFDTIYSQMMNKKLLPLYNALPPQEQEKWRGLEERHFANGGDYAELLSLMRSLSPDDFCDLSPTIHNHEPFEATEEMHNLHTLGPLYHGTSGFSDVMLNGLHDMPASQVGQTDDTHRWEPKEAKKLNGLTGGAIAWKPYVTQWYREQPKELRKFWAEKYGIGAGNIGEFVNMTWMTHDPEEASSYAKGDSPYLQIDPRRTRGIGWFMPDVASRHEVVMISPSNVGKGYISGPDAITDAFETNGPFPPHGGKGW